MKKDFATLSHATEFEVPASQGSTIIDTQYFRHNLFSNDEDCETQLEVDSEFQRHVKVDGLDYRNGAFRCVVYRMHPVGADLDNSLLHAMVVGGIRGSMCLHTSQICGTLKYLGDKGAQVLAVPAGKVELRLILSYLNPMKPEEVRVLYVSHKIELEGHRKKHRLHLRVGSVNDGEDCAILVLTVP